MKRSEFFEAIKDDFFNERTADFESFKSMVNGAMPVFGTLETTLEDNENGKIITFIDNDKADLVISDADINVDEVETDMSTILMKLTLNKDGVIETVSHGIHGLFTPANKEKVLLLASFIGKKITF